MHLIFSLFIFLQPLFILPVNTDEYIKWDKNRPLTWNDFLASPKTNTSAVATTSTQLSIKFFKKNNLISYQITCQFVKKGSWVSVQNDYILKHEQGHFDIAEFFARKLNKTLQEHLKKNPGNIKDLDFIYNDLMNQKDNFQNKYDLETQNSINKPKQEEWLLKIEVLLYSLSEYSNYN